MVEGQTFMPFDINKVYLISYSQIKTKLLAKPYDTNCKDYDINNIDPNLNMRSDCINQCVIKMF